MMELKICFFSQNARAETDSAEDVTKLRAFIAKIEALRNLKQSFHIVSNFGSSLRMKWLTIFCCFTQIIDDPSGNSFIQNIYAPNMDPEMTFTNYRRTPALDELCGLQVTEERLFRCGSWRDRLSFQPQPQEEDNVNDEVCFAQRENEYSPFCVKMSTEKFVCFVVLFVFLFVGFGIPINMLRLWQRLPNQHEKLS